MNIRSAAESVYHIRVSRHTCKHSQLNLRIVRIAKNSACGRVEILAQPPALRRSYGNILQVRLKRAYSARARLCLVKGGVYSAVLCYAVLQAVGIGGFKLCKLAVIKQQRYRGVLVFKPLQHLCARAVAAFGLLFSGQPQLFKKRHAQLLW